MKTHITIDDRGFYSGESDLSDILRELADWLEDGNSAEGAVEINTIAGFEIYPAALVTFRGRKPEKPA